MAVRNSLLGVSLIAAGSVVAEAQELELLEAAIESPLTQSEGNSGFTSEWHTGQDAAGNVYVATRVPNEMEWTIGSQVTSLTTSPESSGFVLLKFGRSRRLEFAHLIEGAGVSAGPTIDPVQEEVNLAVAPNGDFYITGSVSAPADFDPGPAEWILSPSSNPDDEFPHYLAKYDADGNLYWAQLINPDPHVSDETGHLALTADGGIMVGMVIHETMDIDPGDGVHEVVIESDDITVQALVKFSPAGAFEYAHLFHFSTPGWSAPGLLWFDIDDAGRIYVEGYFSGEGPLHPVEIDLDPGPGVFNPDVSYRYRLRLHPDGNLDQALLAFDSHTDHTELNLGNLAHIGADQLLVYEKHGVNPPGDIDPGPGVVIPATRGPFLLQLTDDSNYIRHVEFLSGVQRFNDIDHVSRAPNGDIFVSGFNLGSLEMVPGPGGPILETPYVHFYPSAFLLHLSAELEFINVYAVPGSPDIQGRRVHTFDHGDVWWHGQVLWDGWMDLDPTSGTLEILSGNGFLNGPEWSFALWLGPPNPDVVSIARVDASPTNASSVRYAVEFEEPVTGVDAGDFEVETTGTLTGAPITDFSGIGASYAVTLSVGAGDGDVQLKLIDDDSITNAAGRFLGGKAAGNGDFAGEVYTIDRTPPALSVSGPSPNVTATGPVTFTVEYTDADAITLAASDVNLVTTGTAAGTLSVLESGIHSRIIVVDGITGAGTIAVSIDAGTAVDSVGNLSLLYGPSAAVNVNPAALAVNLGPPSAFITNAGPVTYTAHYDNAANVILSESDITLDTTGTASAEVSVSGSGTETRTISIDNPSGEGAITFSIAPGSALDAASNPAPAAGPAIPFIIDSVAPEVLSVAPMPSEGFIQAFTVTFSEPVTGVDPSDFTPRSVFSAFVTGVSGASPGAVYTVSVDAGTGSGVVVLAVEDDDTILDLAGNPLGGPGIGNGGFNEGPATLPLAGAVLSIIAVLFVLGLARFRRATA
jgi:hypothetical protein